MKSILICMVFILTCFSISIPEAEVYYWTDENGVKHYSNMPPSDRVVRIKTYHEVQYNRPDAEKMDEKDLDKETETSAGKRKQSQKSSSREELIQKEKEQLEEIIVYLENLPPDAFANSRSRQVIIGRYRYRLQRLLKSPQEYFGW